MDRESEDDEVMSGVGRVAKQEIQEIRLALNLIESGQYGNALPAGTRSQRLGWRLCRM